MTSVNYTSVPSFDHNGSRPVKLLIRKINKCVASVEQLQ